MRAVVCILAKNEITRNMQKLFVFIAKFRNKSNNQPLEFR